MRIVTVAIVTQSLSDRLGGRVTPGDRVREEPALGGQRLTGDRAGLATVATATGTLQHGDRLSWKPQIGG